MNILRRLTPRLLREDHLHLACHLSPRHTRIGQFNTSERPPRRRTAAVHIGDPVLCVMVFSVCMLGTMRQGAKRPVGTK